MGHTNNCRWTFKTCPLTNMWSCIRFAPRVVAQFNQFSSCSILTRTLLGQFGFDSWLFNAYKEREWILSADCSSTSSPHNMCFSHDYLSSTEMFQRRCDNRTQSMKMTRFLLVGTVRPAVALSTQTLSSCVSSPLFNYTHWIPKIWYLTLEDMQSYKYLGTVIDSKLNFEANCEAVC